MSISKVTAFFSYAHKDDTFNFLTDLRNDLCGEYCILTGDDLELFFDRDSIDWGDRWEESIAGGIDTAGLFIPVLSPNYFGSANCVLELNQYLEKARRIGTKELVLPLLLTEFGKGQQSVNPKLLEEIMGYQYRDISKMRLLDRGCGNYKLQLNELARGIHTAEMKVIDFATREANNPVEAPTTCSAPNSLQQDDDVNESEEDKPFLAEAMADLPDKLTEMTGTLNSLSENIGAIDTTLASEADALNKPGLTPKEALAITVRLANALGPVANRMESDADAFALQVAEIDPLVKAVMEFNGTALGTAEIDPLGLTNLTKEAATARESIQFMLNATKDAKYLSRALYKPLKTVERATATCLGAYDIVISWSDLVPATDDVEPATNEAAE